MASLGQPKFRSQQLYEWLYLRRAASYGEMTNLPAALRDRLEACAPLHTPRIVEDSASSDGTRKFLISFHDGVCVEAVGIPSRDGRRLTVCFSTQAGCPMECAFCATGQEGLTRNLVPGEIVDQVLIVQEAFGRRVSNLVGMGQGEPFLNYDNTLAALRILNDPKGIAIGSRHISVSTCGVIPGIERLAGEPEQFTLAVSLHSAVQETRTALMPKTAAFPLPRLKRALKAYVEQTNRRVTIEYIMIDGVNDTDAELDALLAFCKGLLCHVNLIPMNAVPGSPYQPSRPGTVAAWLAAVEKRGIEGTLRDSRGSDIAGACGQLKNTYLKGHR